MVVPGSSCNPGNDCTVLKMDGVFYCILTTGGVEHLSKYQGLCIIIFFLE